MSFDTDQSAQKEQTSDQGVTFNVGDRQYDTEAAIKKITSADEHIARLEAEKAEERQRIAELEAKLAQSTKLEDALQKLKAGNTESQSGEVTPSFDPETLSKAAREAALAALQEQQQLQAQQSAQQVQEQTFAETQAKLVAMYGSTGVDSAIQEKAGISVEKAMEMAKDPEASKLLLKIMQVDDAKPSLSPSGGHHNKLTPTSNRIFEGKKHLTASDIENAYRRFS